MSKFLTPPVWYDGYGTLNDMLTGKSVEVEGGNVVIGSSAEAGANVFTSVVIYGSATGTQSAPTSNAIIAGNNASASSTGVVAIGAGSSATAEGAVASGLSAKAKNTGAIAIGRNAEAEASGSIAIGDGASAPSQNTIQLGNNSTAYTLNVGNGNGTINGTASMASMATKASMAMNWYEYSVPKTSGEFVIPLGKRKIIGVYSSDYRFSGCCYYAGQTMAVSDSFLGPTQKGRDYDGSIANIAIRILAKTATTATVKLILVDSDKEAFNPDWVYYSELAYS